MRNKRTYFSPISGSACEIVINNFRAYYCTEKNGLFTCSLMADTDIPKVHRYGQSGHLELSRT